MAILDGYKAGKPVPIPGMYIDGIWLERNTAMNYYQMALAAWNDGIRLIPSLGFRDHEYQTELYFMTPEEKKKRGVGKIVAKPGFSNHQQGKCIDFENVARYFDWLTKNAAKYGFKMTVPSEKWHWEFVGF